MKKGNVNITPVLLPFCDPQCYADAYELHILTSCEACRYSSYFIDLKSQLTWWVFVVILFVFPLFVVKLNKLLNF